MDPVEALERIAFLLERSLAPTYRVRAFRTAARVLTELPADEVRARADAGSLESLKGIGPKTAQVVREALAGDVPGYLEKLEGEATAPRTRGGEKLRALLRGDCHLHSDWSDGGSPIEEMGRTAADLGHEWAVLTDHSPRLTVARGLSPERLRHQLDVVAELNETWAPFRLLTGIECDILDDGSLDQEPELLERLDVVVGPLVPRCPTTSRREPVSSYPRPYAPGSGGPVVRTRLVQLPDRVQATTGSWQQLARERSLSAVGGRKKA